MLNRLWFKFYRCEYMLLYLFNFFFGGGGIFVFKPQFSMLKVDNMKSKGAKIISTITVRICVSVSHPNLLNFWTEFDNIWRRGLFAYIQCLDTIWKTFKLTYFLFSFKFSYFLTFYLINIKLHWLVTLKIRAETLCFLRRYI